MADAKRTFIGPTAIAPLDQAQAPPTELAAFSSCATETTRQVLATQRWRDDLERFVALFDQAPTFMALLRGPEHRFELANAAYLRLVGNRPVIGRTLAEALPEAVAQGNVACWIASITLASRTRRWRQLHPARNGRRYRTKLARFCVPADQGRCRCGVGYLGRRRGRNGPRGGRRHSQRLASV